MLHRSFVRFIASAKNFAFASSDCLIALFQCVHVKGRTLFLRLDADKPCKERRLIIARSAMWNTLKCSDLVVEVHLDQQQRTAIYSTQKEGEGEQIAWFGRSRSRCINQFNTAGERERGTQAHLYFGMAFGRDKVGKIDISTILVWAILHLPWVY